MVRVEDFINSRYPDPLDREIMRILNNLNDWRSGSEMMNLCKTTHHGGKRYTIRSIEPRLKALVKNGDLILRKDPATGVGAPTKRYHISVKFKTDRDKYMETRTNERILEMKLSLGTTRVSECGMGLSLR